MDSWKTWKMPLKAALPLFSIGVITLLISLCFCCYLWRLKRQGRVELGYKDIRYKKKKKHTTETCSVCLDDFNDGEKISECTCKHRFHQKCLLQWLNQNNSCPLCKAKVRRGSRDNERTCLVRNNSRVAYV